MLETDAAANRVTVGPRAELETSSVRIRGARLHRDAERVDAVRLRYHSPSARAALEVRRGREGEATLALAEPADGVAPGQVACLMDGDLVVGHGTIV